MNLLIVLRISFWICPLLAMGDNADPSVDTCLLQRATLLHSGDMASNSSHHHHDADTNLTSLPLEASLVGQSSTEQAHAAQSTLTDQEEREGEASLQSDEETSQKSELFPWTFRRRRRRKQGCSG